MEIPEYDEEFFRGITQPIGEEESVTNIGEGDHSVPLRETTKHFCDSERGYVSSTERTRILAGCGHTFLHLTDIAGLCVYPHSDRKRKNKTNQTPTESSVSYFNRLICTRCHCVCCSCGRTVCQKHSGERTLTNGEVKRLCLRCYRIEQAKSVLIFLLSPFLIKEEKK